MSFHLKKLNRGFGDFDVKDTALLLKKMSLQHDNIVASNTIMILGKFEQASRGVLSASCSFKAFEA